MELENNARQALADLGYDPIYGARPLKRVIQKHVQDLLAHQILKGEVLDGDSLLISSDEKGLVISKK